MKEKVLETIKKYNLIENGDKLVLGVSGGPDSISMLNILNQIKKQGIIDFKIYVAHINHMIRKEAKTDEEYVDLWQTFLNQEVKTKSAREVFIEENMTQFIYFKIRVYLIFILYVITIMANSYLILKLEKAIKARKILDKDDKIIFKNNI